MSAIRDLDDLAQRFDADRRHLRSVAFQLLGSLADAEDAVQSAWLKASRFDHESLNAIENLTGWFTTITAREAIDQLRMRKRRAERPLVDVEELDRLAVSAPADQDTLLADAVSGALLVVLDRLSPEQRVAFVLHDVFAVPFDTIAGLLDRSPAAAKKLASRARQALHTDVAAQPHRVAEHVAIVEAFLSASRGGDIAALLDLLAPDVVRTADAALVPDDVPTELRGAAQVAEETRRFTHRARAGAVMLIDGIPGVVIASGGRVQVLLQIGIGEDDRIHAITITADAERLSGVALTLPHRTPQNDHKSVGYQGHHK
jgi:RNA polymerase sigma factor (sigma-70 family)